ncbi:MAG: hypothetical protein ACREDL_06620, partial [Bradyrhizobium sp.]
PIDKIGFGVRAAMRIAAPEIRAKFGFFANLVEFCSSRSISRGNKTRFSSSQRFGRVSFVARSKSEDSRPFPSGDRRIMIQGQPMLRDLPGLGRGYDLKIHLFEAANR